MDFLLTSSVIFIHLLHAVTTKDPCLPRCNCEWLKNSQYSVTCKEKGLTSIPDLNALQNVRGQLLLAFEVNRIRNVTRDNFQARLRVKMLILRSNPLVIDNSAFANVADSLEILDLSSTSLQFDNFEFLRGLGKLSLLMLDGNPQRTKTLRNGVFSNLGLTSLNQIRFKDCDIAVVEDDAFRGVENVVTLDLHHNLLTTLPRGAMRRLRNLQNLNLNRNRILALRKGTFSGLPNLKYLNIGDNRGISVEDGAFDGVQDSLTKIQFSECGLDDFPAAFRSLKKLTHLTIRDNPLKRLVNVDGDYCLRFIDISATNFTLDAGVFKQQGGCLREVHINRRGLTSVPTEALKPLKAVTKLKLNFNEIKVLSFNAFDSIPATDLSLKGNPLTTVEAGSFVGLYSGLVINLDQTLVTDISFVLHYARSTFLGLSLYGTRLNCDCTLYAVVRYAPNIIMFGNCRFKDGNRYYVKGSRTTRLLRTECERKPSTSVTTVTLRKPTTTSTTTTTTTLSTTTTTTTPSTTTTTTTPTTTTSTTTTTTTPTTTTSTTTTTTTPTTTTSTTTTTTTTTTTRKSTTTTLKASTTTTTASTTSDKKSTTTEVTDEKEESSPDKTNLMLLFVAAAVTVIGATLYFVYYRHKVNELREKRIQGSPITIKHVRRHSAHGSELSNGETNVGFENLVAGQNQQNARETNKI